MGESTTGPTSNVRRVYPLDAHDLTEEQIAVVFAMTSRRPEAFDEIAQQMDRSSSGVRTLWARALERLRKELKEMP